MASKTLNADAPAFVPGSWTSTDSSIPDLGTEDHITAEELEELEAAEAWVEELVRLEEEEEDHLVAVALRYAPQDKVAEIQRRCGVKGSQLHHHKGIHAHAAGGTKAM